MRPSRRVKPILSLQRAVKAVEPWGILIAVWALLLSLVDRVEDRTVNAWQLLTAQAPGNSGKAEALAYLNSEKGHFCAEFLRDYLARLRGNDRTTCLLSLKAPSSLSGIDLSPPDPEDNGTPGYWKDDPVGAYLASVDLQNADLERATLRRANLSRANLKGANLMWADLSRTNLWVANLQGAQLEFVNLTGANLSNTDLSGATLFGSDLISADLNIANLTETILEGVDLSGADLTVVFGLSQNQLNTTCGDENTKLPKDMKIAICPPKVAK